MLLNEKSGESEQAQYEIDAAFWKSEFECPICFEVRVTTVILQYYNVPLQEMRPPMRIWQCVDGHPVCEGCRDKLDTR